MTKVRDREVVAYAMTPRRMNTQYASTPSLCLFANNTGRDDVIVSSGPLPHDVGDIEAGTHVFMIQCPDLNYIIAACDAFIHDISIHRQLFIQARDAAQTGLKH